MTKEEGGLQIIMVFWGKKNRRKGTGDKGRNDARVSQT